MRHPERERVNGNDLDILLIPPLINPFFSDSLNNFMPLGLLALVASLRRERFSSQIYKPWKRLIHTEDYHTIAADIVNRKPGIIGFSTWCITYPASVLISKQIKSLNPEIPIIFGGPHASILRQETLNEFKSIDFVLAGETDATLSALVKLLLNGFQVNDLLKISGLSFRQEDGKICNNKLNEVVSNLDELPVPAYDLVRRNKSLKMDVGRGCPYICTYCSTNSFFSKKYRTKSPDRIIGEMNHSFEKYGIRKFSFAHDLFTLNQPFIFNLCEKLVKQYKSGGSKFTWTCSSRIDSVSEELLKAMKEAGCQSIFFGVESGSEKIQQIIRKNLQISKVHEIAEICRGVGIDVYASFITGFPDESEEDIEKSLRTIFKLATRGVFTQISELSLLPGTSLFPEFKDQLKFDGTFSNFSECICGKDEMDLIRKYPEIFSSFYYLPVKTIERDSVHLLCNLINSLGDFRNTLFLLGDSLNEATQQIGFLTLFRENLPNIKNQLKSGMPPVSFWIRAIENYLIYMKGNGIFPEVYDVFAFEALKAMLQAKFARWQIIHPQISNAVKDCMNEGDYLNVGPSPFWQVLTTSYKLSSVLPAMNGWHSGKSKARKGIYFYLVIATSEKRCKFLKINNMEFQVLKNSPEMTAFKTKIDNRFVEKSPETLTFSRKMKKLGIINI